MSLAQGVYARAFAEGLRPDPALTVSEWAEAHRMLSPQSTAEPGPWRTERTPYLKEIMDALSVSNSCEMVVLMKGAQLGGTECGNNWLGYVIHHAPGPMLFVQPTVEMAKRTSKQRITPMIDACPALTERVQPARSRDSGNTLLAKEFPGGILVMTGANSAVGLRSMPVRYLFLDEVDGYESDVDGEGDPVELAMKRTSTYARNRKVFLVSTPTVRGLSRIEAAWERSDQRYFQVPCPHCGERAPILWRNLRWPEGKPEDAHLVCEACGKEIPERHKETMLASGEWVPTKDSAIRGYHLSALYSPLGWYSWAKAAEDFLEAKRMGPEGLKTWTNTVLGETWEEQGEAVQEGSLIGRREQYPAEVPAAALVLTAGIDVQDDRLEMEVVGWGKGEESWGIEYRTVWGDPGRPAVWQQLDEALAKIYQHENGHRLRVVTACIDSGHATQQVYEHVLNRAAGGLFAVKGMAGTGRPILSAPSKRKTGYSKRTVPVFLVGVDEAKGLLYSRLRLREPGPGFCHFPIEAGYDVEYFAQLTAEKCITRYTRGFPRREWVKVRPRNEALDCRVYATAALYLLRPAWDVLEERMKPATAAPKKPGPVRRPRRNWVNSWREW